MKTQKAHLTLSQFMWVHGTPTVWELQKAGCISGFVKNILHVCLASTANLVWTPRFIFVLGPELTSTVSNFNTTRCRHQLTTIFSVATSSPLYTMSPLTNCSIQCRLELCALFSVTTSSPLYPVSQPTHLYPVSPPATPLSSVASNSAL